MVFEGDVYTTKSDRGMAVYRVDSGRDQHPLLRYGHLSLRTRRSRSAAVRNQRHSRRGSVAVLLRATSLRLVLRLRLVLDRLHPARVRPVRRRPHRKLRDGHVRRESRALPVSSGTTSGQFIRCSDQCWRQGESADLVDGNADDPEYRVPSDNITKCHLLPQN